MPNRGPALLIVALASVFVGVVLVRCGAFTPRERRVQPASPVTADTLPAPPPAITWLGGHPVTGGSLTALVVWDLSDPGSLAAADRAEQWRLLYAPLGARVIGVYAPHAGFDTDSSVVATEVARRDLGYPVALDATLAWTRAFSGPGPRPRVVLADSLGRVRWSGRDVDHAEKELVRLVVERRPDLASGAGADSTTAIDTGGAAGSDTAVAVHAPVWLGLADHPPGPLADVTPGGPRMFHAELKTEIASKTWVPTPIGLWTPGADGLSAARGGAEQYVALRYDAGPLAVLAGAPAGKTIRVWVFRDDEDEWIPRDARGADMKFDGRGASYVDVSWPRLYDVVRADGRGHVINLSPAEAGLTLRAFVFEPVPPVPARP
jgi:hypothetical protein